MQTFGRQGGVHFELPSYGFNGRSTGVPTRRCSPERFREGLIAGLRAAVRARSDLWELICRWRVLVQRRLPRPIFDRHQTVRVSPRKIAIASVLICLCLVIVYVKARRGPYARLERMGQSALRLSSPGVAPSLKEHIVGVLHRRDPRLYFADEAQIEQEKLLAAGLLVETKVPIQVTRSADEVYKALWNHYQTSGAYWSATVDLTNRIVLLVSKPGDAASFAAALTNE